MRDNALVLGIPVNTNQDNEVIAWRKTDVGC